MRTRVTLTIALGLLALTGLLYLSQNDPEGGSGIFPKCFFKKHTGYHCPGCGSTRAAYALSQFDLGRAFGKNPLLVIALPFLAAGFAMEGTAWLFGERYKGPRVRLRPWMAWLIVGTIFAYWILRNIPVWPFTLLAPS